jgi:hypothetical protein
VQFFEELLVVFRYAWGHGGCGRLLLVASGRRLSLVASEGRCGSVGTL